MVSVTRPTSTVSVKAASTVAHAQGALASVASPQSASAEEPAEQGIGAFQTDVVQFGGVFLPSVGVADDLTVTVEGNARLGTFNATPDPVLVPARDAAIEAVETTETGRYLLSVNDVGGELELIGTRPPEQPEG